MDLEQRLQQRLETGQRELCGCVAQCLRRIVMDFHEEPVDAARDPRAREVLDVLGLTVAGVAESTRELNAMRDRKSVV